MYQSHSILNMVEYFKRSLLSLLLPAASFAAVITVYNGDDLAAKISQAAGGDTVIVGNGTYGGFQIPNRSFTQARPLIIKAAPGTRPLIQGSGGYLTPISGSSYIVLDGLTLEGSNQPVYCTDIDHIIFINLEIRNTGQEAIHVRGTSRYVDIINCHIHHTGSNQPQWAEGIYIGSGSLPFMNEEYIWIEGNEIHHTGNSEAINIKPQSYHVTIRGNTVHDIFPGTDTQYNQAAISLEAPDFSFKPGENPDIWIEDNEIYNVIYGRWANGIQATAMGPKIKGNYIHDCQEYGLYFNSYGSGPGNFTTYLYDNRIENCGEASNSTSLPYLEQDPGNNPNQPQDWYQSAVGIRQLPESMGMPVLVPGIRVFKLYDLKGRVIRTAVSKSYLLNSSIPAGLYILVSGNGQNSTIRKLVLK